MFSELAEIPETSEKSLILLAPMRTPILIIASLGVINVPLFPFTLVHFFQFMLQVFLGNEITLEIRSCTLLVSIAFVAGLPTFLSSCQIKTCCKLSLFHYDEPIIHIIRGGVSPLKP